MEKRLNRLGIQSCADLAAADASGLTAKLKADKAVVSESQVAAWITAAKAQ
jgi:nucleotidyltransferase/DNA polymerase involved in DNA repair